MPSRVPLPAYALALLLIPAAGCSGGGTVSSGGIGGFVGGELAGGGIGGAVSGGTISGGNSGGSDCSACATSCGNGLVSVGGTGCGADCSTSIQFCPGGCSPDGTTCLGPDGALDSCIASQLIATTGLLASGGEDGGVAIAQGSTLLLATSPALACEWTVDGGILPPEAPAAIVAIDLSSFAGGTGGGLAGLLTIAAGTGLAVLTTWSDGGLTRATGSGAVDMTLDQLGGGMIGNYSLTFGTDAENGTFTAPACDVCATPP